MKKIKYKISQFHLEAVKIGEVEVQKKPTSSVIQILGQLYCSSHPTVPIRTINKYLDTVWID